MPDTHQPSQSRALRPIDQIRHQLDLMTPEFAVALPQHIPVDRFKRTVLTAVNQNPQLLNADRKSLLGACMRASQDGLYPDGREGALVIFRTKVRDDKGERWTDAVQWMPMVYGILKKMRNSGELASITARAVYQNDTFRYVLGDEESIEHEPCLDGDPGELRAVYAVAKLKDGTVQREVMTKAQIEKVRGVSRAKDKGPWVDWYDEMARKTVIRRLSKYLPMSTEIDEMLRREDAESVIAREDDEPAPPRPTRQQFAAPAGPVFDAEVVQDEPAAAYDLVDAFGEVVHSYDRPAPWLEHYGRLVAAGGEHRRAIIEHNAETAQRILDGGEVGNAAEVLAEIHVEPKRAASEPAKPAAPTLGDEWDAELGELRQLARRCKDKAAFAAFVDDYRARIESFTGAPERMRAWQAFAAELDASLPAKAGKA